jgi:hypothetical protein
VNYEPLAWRIFSERGEILHLDLLRLALLLQQLQQLIQLKPHQRQLKN